MKCDKMKYISDAITHIKYNKIKYISDAIIQNGQFADDCLHRSGFNVDPELFCKNKEFSMIILKIIDYMTNILKTDFKDYNTLKGISGANVGIPFNIVIILDDDLARVFINPKIIKKSRSKTSVLSNCGSVNLSKSIKIERHLWIQIEWMDISGKYQNKFFVVENDKTVCIPTTPQYNIEYNTRITLTLQHEIEHNKGILIINKKRL